GYPPEDLVLKPDFLVQAREALASVQKMTAEGGPAVLVGLPWWEEDAGSPSRHNVFNAAVLIDKGEIIARQFKHDLPNYGVFDEKRVFQAGPLPRPIPFQGINLGLLI